MRPTLPGEKPDDEYDALPVETLEPQSDPVRNRPGAPELLDAHKKIFNGDKAAAAKTYGLDYAVHVLDQLNIETMLANRVAVGPGLARAAISVGAVRGRADVSAADRPGSRIIRIKKRSSPMKTGC